MLRKKTYQADTNEAHGSFERTAVLRPRAALLPLLAALSLLDGPGARAQLPLSNLVVTVGTTIQTNGNDYSYVLLGAPQLSLLAGKHFAIYSKPGFPTNSGSFSLRGTIFQQTDAGTINSLLNQSVVFGTDLNELGTLLNTLLHNVPGIAGLPLAQKVQTAFQVAASDPATAQMLGLLEHVNPGLTLCAGQAFSEVITAITTYEAREVNPDTGVAGDVLGRVTITPGAPVVLPAPGFPFQVKTNAPSDHLVIRLRWGTPPELRRLSLLSYGFNIWRIPQAKAVAMGYDTTPPTILQLHLDPSFTLVNHAPVMATKDYATGHGPGGADDPSDPTTYFFTDNHGHALGNAHFPSNSPPHFGYLTPPFKDGEQFYYFVTARDVLGRDGFVSNGAQAEACRRLPPQAPTKVRVQNHVQVATISGSKTNLQRLLVSWPQNFNTNDQVNEYWVYRWPNPSMALTNDFAPLSNRVGVVSQVLGTNTGYFLDNGDRAPVTPGLSNFWYTVRAVSQAACDPLLSPPSMPAWGVLRERFGPDATTGELLGSCGTPAVMFLNFNSTTNSSPLDVFHFPYRFTCQRRDSGIAWVQFFATNTDGSMQTFGPLFFPPDGNTLSADDVITVAGTNYLTSVACVAGTYYGQVSQPAVAYFAAPAAFNVRQEAVFFAGELLLTALDPADPLLAGITGGQENCLPAFAVKAYPDGTVCMRFDINGNLPLLIQVETNASGTAVLWADVGVATPDTNGLYCISYPACLLGPLPPFRGCPLSLPTGCTQHVPRGGGNGSVAPVQISFVLTPRTHEYRVYRSIDNGPLTLLAQAGETYDPSDPQRTIVLSDDVMPPGAARLCYYVQLLDEHGNGSPMALIGCLDVVPPKPPRPILAAPHSAGDSSNPQVSLNWFCPTSGVYRFELMVQRTDNPSLPTGVSAPNLTPLPVFNVLAVYYGLFPDFITLAEFGEADLTPPIRAGFGPGPQFNLTASVLPNVPYQFSVQAMDAQGNVGDASEVWSFTWKPTDALPTVPWPARPLPATAPFDDVPVPIPYVFQPRVQAVLLRNPNRQLDSLYPVGVRIGDLSSLAQPPYTIGTTNLVTYDVAAPFSEFGLPPPPADPHTLVFRRASNDPVRNGQLLLPIVVYRQQVTNANFSRVSSSLTQVTPLIERLPYSSNTDTNVTYPATTVTIYDRLIAAGSEFLIDWSWNFLYVRDQQPVMVGATYNYFVVRFNNQHEISEIIPAGTVTIPNQAQ